MLNEFGTHVLAELASSPRPPSTRSARCYARRLRGLAADIVAAGQLTMSTVLLLPFVLLFDRPRTLLTASRTAIWAMLALALLSLVACLSDLLPLIARAGATNALLVTFLIPVSAILLGHCSCWTRSLDAAPARRHGRDLHRRRRHRRPGRRVHRTNAARTNSDFPDRRLTSRRASRLHLTNG